MTLIVGRRFAASVRLVTDSKVTDESVLRGTHLTGALKAVIVNRALCIGCAGNRAHAAFEAIRGLRVGDDFDVRDVERHFQHAAKAVDGANQFLARCCSEGKQERRPKETGLLP